MESCVFNGFKYTLDSGNDQICMLFCQIDEKDCPSINIEKKCIEFKWFLPWYAISRGFVKVFSLRELPVLFAGASYVFI